MNILKALNALSPSPAPENDKQNARPTPPAAAPEERGGERSNIMAQTIMRHEEISNRVHSRKK